MYGCLQTGFKWLTILKCCRKKRELDRERQRQRDKGRESVYLCV